MASVKKTNEGTWEVRYRTPEGGYRRKRFAKRVDADKFATSTEHTKLIGAYVDPAEGRTTFKAYAEQWRGLQVYRENTASAVKSRLERHVYPTIGGVALGAILPSHLRAVVKKMVDAELEPSTIGVTMVHVASILKAAVGDRKIAVSPFVNIARPKIDGTVITPPTTEQVAALWGAAPDRMKAYVVVGAGSGLRPGELLGLTVDRVDFLRRLVRVDRQLLTPNTAGRVLRLDEPKTAAGHRTVPVGDTVISALARHLERHEPGDWGVIFTKDDGGLWDRQRFARMWNAMAASVSADVKPHGLRHYYASLLIRRGASVKTVQSRLGHKSAMTTLDTYGHLWPDDEEQTRRAVDDELAALSETPGVNPVSTDEAKEA